MANKYRKNNIGIERNGVMNNTKIKYYNTQKLQFVDWQPYVQKIDKEDIPLGCKTYENVIVSPDFYDKGNYTSYTSATDFTLLRREKENFVTVEPFSTIENFIPSELRYDLYHRKKTTQ